MHRSSAVISVLGSVCLVVVMTVFLYWILTIVAPSPTGWSDEVMWQPVDRLLEEKGVIEDAGKLAGEQVLNRGEVGDAADQDHAEAVNEGMLDRGVSGDGGEIDHGETRNLGEVDGDQFGEGGKVEEATNGAGTVADGDGGEIVDGLDAVTEDGLIAINTATAERLQELPGIGPAKAQAIIDYRNMYGKFNHVDELLGVKGIGEKTLENLRPYIKLD